MSEKARKESVMDKASKRAKRPRRSFTPEFKTEAVRLCQIGDRTISRIASDLNIGDAALREWVRLAKIDAGDGPAGALTTEEREELTRLRREHKRVLMDLEILKKATEFFARRNL